MEIVVSPIKILNYVLVDQQKSKFFRQFGYSEANWQDLQTALISLAKNHPKHLRQRTIYGEEHEIIGPITAPAGRDIIIKSGWMIDSGQPGTIRFVTAYPA